VKRLSKAAVLTVAAGAAVLGTAGGAVAHDGDHGHGSSADAVAVGSPGVASGNVIQVPLDIPVNVCGNSLNFFAALNPAIGNTCVNA
jgi:hypothetical protein